MDFRWNRCSIEHIGRHGAGPREAEEVVLDARQPYPVFREDNKWLVWGRTAAGRLLQVVYVLEEDAPFIIRTRPLTDNEKKADFGDRSEHEAREQTEATNQP